MSKFEFTNNWFDRNINISMKIARELFQNKSVHILEIGSHEGKSTVWMLENLCNIPESSLTSIDPYSTYDITTPVIDETYHRFLHNIKLCRNYDKFNQYVDYSAKVLPKLLEHKKKYDIIYIDGSHLMNDVIVDLNYSNMLIKSGGIIIMDDVGWDVNKNDGVVGALKVFLSENSNHYNILLKEYQWVLYKK